MLMKNIARIALILLCFYAAGCSVPSTAGEKYLYGISREEKKQDNGIFGNKKYIEIKDFRGNERYDEDFAALKEEVEKYITLHPGLSEEVKSALRELKVAAGLKTEEVKLLLGRPDRAMKDIWVYRISKWRAFTIFIVPVFFVHEGYYLYFKDGVLDSIERHYLTQTIHQNAAEGVYQQKNKGSSK